MIGASLAAVALAGVGVWGIPRLVAGGDGDDDPRAAASASVDVPATETWTDSTLACVAGDRLDITATGLIRFGSDPSQTVDADGLSDPANRVFNLDELPDANTDALIASVQGMEPYVVVGTEHQGICPANGRLLLGINETELGNNDGAFEVTATVTPADGEILAENMRVPGHRTWTPTAIECAPGDTLRFVSSGGVQHGPSEDRVSGPDGTTEYRPEWNVPGLEAENHASLIGSLAQNGASPFVIGTGRDVECAADGRLSLGINDAASDIGLNEGEFTVSVIHQRPAG